MTKLKSPSAYQRTILISVVSSNLKNVGFDLESGVIVVEFHSGAKWGYPGFKQGDFDNLRDADSVGKHFNDNIKTKAENAFQIFP
jgi:hypothetical protein